VFFKINQHLASQLTLYLKELYLKTNMESEHGSQESEIPWIYGYHHFQVPCKKLREWSFYHQHYIKDPRPSQRCVSLKRALGARSFALHQFKGIENGASCAWKSCCKQLNFHICHAKHVNYPGQNDTNMANQVFFNALQTFST